MSNPFDALNPGKPERPVDEGEQWGGAFSCQAYRCPEVVGIADYDSANRILTWACDNGHVSRIEDIE